jgi:hypothetical protein
MTELPVQAQQVLPELQALLVHKAHKDPPVQAQQVLPDHKDHKDPLAQQVPPDQLRLLCSTSAVPTT